MRRHSGSLAFMIHHAVLSYHPESLPAALASECAARVGKFAPFHSILFRHQKTLAKRPWQSYALLSGIADTAAFSTCLSNPETMAAIRADLVAVRHLAAPTIPVIIVGDSLYSGLPWDLESITDRALRKSALVFK